MVEGFVFFDGAEEGVENFLGGKSCGEGEVAGG